MDLTKSNYASTADILYIIVQNRIQHIPQSQYYLCDNRHQVQSRLIPLFFHLLHHQLWKLLTHFPTTYNLPLVAHPLTFESTGNQLQVSITPESQAATTRAEDIVNREIHVRKNNAHARSEMTRKYNKHHLVQSFVVGQCHCKYFPLGPCRHR